MPARLGSLVIDNPTVGHPVAANDVAVHQALYRRWRAQTFAEIVGQTAVVTTLRNAVRTGRVAHAILFTGPRGTGKTSLARIVAKAINCTDLSADGDPCDRCPSCVAIREGRALDLVEIDAASNRGIDAVRELRERIHYAPTDLRRKVYILDEAHQITRDAWNALLKSLEEPPEFVTFMFASTHPQEFPPAILSRLQRYDVRRLTVPEIVGKLERILAADGRSADRDAIELIARLAAGGMRDAESILDQLLSSTDGPIAADGVRELLGLADAESVERFVDAVAKGDAAGGIAVLDALDDRGRDPRIFLDQLVDALRERIVAGIGGPPTSEREALLSAARRFGSLDPTRIGPGGIRFQLELALLSSSRSSDVRAAPTGDSAATSVAADAKGRARTPARDRAPRAVDAPVTGQPVTGQQEAGQPRRTGGDSETWVATGPGRPPGAAATTAAAPIAGAPDAGGSDSDVSVDPAGPPGGPPVPTGPAPRREPTRASTVEGPAKEGAPKAAVSTALPSAPGSDDLDRLRSGWSSIVASVRPATRALIAECRPLAVDGNVVTLGFPEAKAFLKDVAERKSADLEAAVGGHLGRVVAVRCVATNLDLVPALPEDEDAARVLEEARRIFAEDLADVREVG